MMMILITFGIQFKFFKNSSKKKSYPKSHEGHINDGGRLYPPPPPWKIRLSKLENFIRVFFGRGKEFCNCVLYAIHSSLRCLKLENKPVSSLIAPLL